MRKLNNRGYLIVELILASVLAMTVAYFLLNLVVKMSAKNQDLYLETELLTDKAIMTNMVMEDVNKYTLAKIDQKSSEDNKVSMILLRFNYYDNSNTQKTIDKMVTTDISTKEFKYGEVNCTAFDFSKCSYKDNETITKKLNSNISTSSISATVKDNNSSNSINDKVLDISMNLNTLYSNANYGLNLTIPYNSEVLELKPTIKVKSEYGTGLTINKGESVSSYIKGYFDYFPSNGTVSCKFNGSIVTTINDVISGKDVGDYSADCKVTYVFKNVSKESDVATLNIHIKSDSGSNPEGNPTGTKYLYYANTIMSSQNTETEHFNIYRCNEDGSDCLKIRDVYGMYTDTTAALSYGLSGVNNSNVSYTSSCKIGNDHKTINTMDIYKCVNDDCKYLTGAAGFANKYYNVSVSSEIVTNKDYMYYSTARYATGVYTSIFDLYVCSNGDNPNCHKFATSYPLVFNGNGSANGNGVSFQPGMTANDSYFFYTDNSSGSSTSLTSNIYRCNKDGTGCSKVGGTSGWAYNGCGSELYPTLISDNNNLYYTSYSSATDGYIYKCNSDGTGCNKLVSATPFINSTKGTGIKIGMALNSKYLYYSTYRYLNGDVINMDIYKVNRSSGKIDKVRSSGATILAGGGMEMQITANDNYVYYTEAMQNSQNSARINKFKVYKCDIEFNDCREYSVNGNGGYLYGLAYSNTGTVIPYKIMLTR